MSHVITLRYSNDGGENYGDARNLDAGDTGTFLPPLIARRLGFCRHRVWEIEDTSDYASDFLSASIIMESE